MIDPDYRELWEVEIAGPLRDQRDVRLVALAEYGWDAILAKAMSMVAVRPWGDGAGPSRGTVTRIEYRGPLHVGIPEGFGTGATCHQCGKPQACWRCCSCERHCTEDWHKGERQ